MLYRWQEELEKLPDNQKVSTMVGALAAIQHDKEKFYGLAGRVKERTVVILANIDRKYDRLDKDSNR